MILRLSAKLATKLKVEPETILPAAADPLADWSATLHRLDRLEFLLLTNTHSLYATVMIGSGITSVPRFMAAAREVLTRHSP
jgi:hypothetical protein